jgi:hypothetical protein
MEVSLDKLLKQEETWWSQRAKVNWLQHGDLNKINFILKLPRGKEKTKLTSFWINKETRLLVTRIFSKRSWITLLIFLPLLILLT